MGGFKAPAPTPHSTPAVGAQAQHTSTSDESTPTAEDEDTCEEPPPAGASVNGRSRLARRRAREAAARGKERSTQLQLYAAAAPKMRRLPQHSGELQSCSAWCQPVRAKPGWQQVQKDYFAAPGEAQRAVPSPVVLPVLCNACQQSVVTRTGMSVKARRCHVLIAGRVVSSIHRSESALYFCLLQALGTETWPHPASRKPPAAARRCLQSHLCLPKLLALTARPTSTRSLSCMRSTRPSGAVCCSRWQICLAGMATCAAAMSPI